MVWWAAVSWAQQKREQGGLRIRCAGAGGRVAVPRLAVGPAGEPTRGHMLQRCIAGAFRLLTQARLTLGRDCRAPPRPRLFARSLRRRSACRKCLRTQGWAWHLCRLAAAP